MFYQMALFDLEVSNGCKKTIKWATSVFSGLHIVSDMPCRKAAFYRSTQMDKLITVTLQRRLGMITCTYDVFSSFLMLLICRGPLFFYKTFCSGFYKYLYKHTIFTSGKAEGSWRTPQFM